MRQTTTIKTIRFIENAEINIYDALDGFFLLKYPLMMTGFWNIIGCRSGKSLLQSKNYFFYTEILIRIKMLNECFWNFNSINIWQWPDHTNEWNILTPLLINILNQIKAAFFYMLQTGYKFIKATLWCHTEIMKARF